MCCALVTPSLHALANVGCQRVRYALVALWTTMLRRGYSGSAKARTEKGTITVGQRNTLPIGLKGLSVQDPCTVYQPIETGADQAQRHLYDARSLFFSPPCPGLLDDEINCGVPGVSPVDAWQDLRSLFVTLPRVPPSRPLTSHDTRTYRQIGAKPTRRGQQHAWTSPPLEGRGVGGGSLCENQYWTPSSSMRQTALMQSSPISLPSNPVGRVP